MKRIRLTRPSPAMVVAVIALIAAMTGSAVGAVIITSTGQIKNGAVTSNDIKNGSVKLADLNSGARQAITRAGDGSQFKAREVVRGFGPVVGVKAGDQTIATMTGLEPGQYQLMAKVNIQLDKVGSDTRSICRMDADGINDFSEMQVGSLATNGPMTHHLQMTRTFGSTGTVTLICIANDGRWSASHASIIATRVGALTRQNVEG